MFPFSQFSRQEGRRTAMRVVGTLASASVPGCPDWSTKSSINFNKSPSTNYGCATTSNLSAMVADPSDLIKGATDTRNDTAAATRPVRTYREKTQTGASGTLKAADTTSGGGQ